MEKKQSLDKIWMKDENAGEEPGMKTPYTSRFNLNHIWLEMSADNKACLLQSFLRCGSIWKTKTFDVELVVAQCLEFQSKHCSIRERFRPVYN